MDFLLDYGLFLAKTITITAAVLIVAGGVMAITVRQRGQARQEIEVNRINDKYEQMTRALESALLPKDTLRKRLKEHKKARKQRSKMSSGERKRVFVLNFDGDIRASRVAGLREEVSAVLTIARTSDEVVVRLESGGGMVHAYGLAASQLERVRSHGIPLTICVDKIAASGGYLMACVANRVVAAPFAIIGSIGVIAQLPNFNKLLRRNEIEFEQITAGEFKRTLTMFGENTDSKRQKMKEDIEETHGIFKEFVREYRPALDIERVATGEHWLAKRARELGLIDELGTSDDLLMAASADCDIIEVVYKPKQNMLKRLTSASGRLLSHLDSELRSDRPQLLM